MKILKIISGGQSGADIAGLKAAKACNILTGGWCPKDYRTEKGSDYSLKQYGLVCTESAGYPQRTELNVQNSDITLIFGNDNSPGCKLTKKLCGKHSKPKLIINNFTRENLSYCYHEILKLPDNLTINIAGNRESSSPGIEKNTKQFLIFLFNQLNKEI